MWVQAHVCIRACVSLGARGQLWVYSSGARQLSPQLCLLSANSTKPGTSETLGSHDDISDHLQQIEQHKGRIAELEMEKPSDRELSQTLENEKNALRSQISAKDGELKLREESSSLTLTL